jgi:single-strand DNA-binding protein
MSDVNKVLLLGRLGRDPEIKYTPNGQAVCNFSLATSEKWTGKDGKKGERTEWHKVVVWAKLAELCGEYLHKGSKVFVDGRIQSRKYQGKDGTERTAFEIVAMQVAFCDSKGQPGQSTAADEEPPPQTDAELPF